MILLRTAAVVAAFALAVVAGGCGGAPSPAPATSAPSASPPAAAPSASASSANVGFYEVDGRKALLKCTGTGSPTVIFEAGLGGDSSNLGATIAELGATTRTCRYDRAGLGFSAAHPGGGELSAGDRADDLHALLAVAGVDGPYVLAGFSYGGMIIRAFTDRYPGEVAGLVFIDSTHEAAWAPGSWILEHSPLGKDGAHALDIDGTRTELLGASDLGDRPTIVLTQGDLNGEFERQWSPIQDTLAALSSDSLHMVATESGHDIRADRPELVHESIRAVIEAVRGTALPPCGPRFEALGAECLAGTMVDLIETWDRLRAEVTPAPGELPRGTYTFKEEGISFAMTVAGGELGVTMNHPDGTVETLTAQYAAVGDKVTFLWPFDYRIGRTSGVNLARWTVDADGTLHFVQIDSERAESWIAAPWVRVESEDAE
jgi:pimeloyl-ACP methyl ester carboxylesterase